jgi:hypothetical protein
MNIHNLHDCFVHHAGHCYESMPWLYARQVGPYTRIYRFTESVIKGIGTLCDMERFDYYGTTGRWPTERMAWNPVAHPLIDTPEKIPGYERPCYR